MPTIIPFDGSSHCLFAGFIEDQPVLVTADGQAHLPNLNKRLVIGNGVASVARSDDGKFILTGGEDGRLCRLFPHGDIQELAQMGKKWLTAVASGPGGIYAAASGRTIIAFDGKQNHEWQEARSIEGLAFAPKGLCLGLARYNGVSLHWLGLQDSCQELEWKGAHQALSFSPDGKFLITSMQENTLHGWRLSDEQHLRMSGYPAKVKSWSWSVKGRHLATSGAMAAIVWPFTTKDGPMGKAPLELGTRANMMVTCVACHPHEEMVAIGYEDGMILFVRFSDSREVLLRRPGQGAITAMGWDGQGMRLAFGSAVGEGGLIDISS